MHPLNELSIFSMFLLTTLVFAFINKIIFYRISLVSTLSLFFIWCFIYLKISFLIFILFIIILAPVGAVLLGNFIEICIGIKPDDKINILKPFNIYKFFWYLELKK